MGEEELLCTVPQLRVTDFTRPPYHILCQDHDSTENDGAAEQSKEQQQQMICNTVVVGVVVLLVRTAPLLLSM